MNDYDLANLMDKNITGLSDAKNALSGKIDSELKEYESCYRYCESVQSRMAKIKGELKVKINEKKRSAGYE